MPDPLQRLVQSINVFVWSQHDRDFIDSVKDREYIYLSAKQQERIFELLKKMESKQ